MGCPRIGWSTWSFAFRDDWYSLSLDIEAQWSAMEKSGQWRFTPPTHVVAAFLTALEIHKVEQLLLVFEVLAIFLCFGQ